MRRGLGSGSAASVEATGTGAILARSLLAAGSPPAYFTMCWRGGGTLITSAVAAADAAEARDPGGGAGPGGPGGG